MNLIIFTNPVILVYIVTLVIKVNLVIIVSMAKLVILMNQVILVNMVSLLIQVDLVILVFIELIESVHVVYFWYGNKCNFKNMQMVAAGRWRHVAASLLRLIVFKLLFFR